MQRKRKRKRKRMRMMMNKSVSIYVKYYGNFNYSIRLSHVDMNVDGDVDDHNRIQRNGHYRYFHN